MSPVLRRAFHWLGSGLAIIGIAFVVFRLHGYWGSLDVSRFTATVWVVLIALILLYSLANLLLAFSWRCLLAQFGVHVTQLWSIRTYGISMIAKYLPGNIFHFAGRQAIGMAAGVSGTELAMSTIWELSLHALSGVLYALMILPLFLPGFPLLVSSVLLIGMIWIVGYMLHQIIGPQVAASFAWQMLFLAVSAGVFATLLGVVVNSSVLHMQTWLLIGGAYIVAWLAGLMTPGAPAGVGIREFTLLLLIRGVVLEEDLLMAILLGRMVTVIGDFLFFICVSLTPSNYPVFEDNHA